MALFISFYIERNHPHIQFQVFWEGHKKLMKSHIWFEIDIYWVKCQNCANLVQVVFEWPLTSVVYICSNRRQLTIYVTWLITSLEKNDCYVTFLAKRSKFKRWQQLSLKMVLGENFWNYKLLNLIWNLISLLLIFIFISPHDRNNVDNKKLCNMK